MSKMPPMDEIADIVKAILAFMPDIEKAKAVIGAIQSNNKQNLKINIKGATTKQGRYVLQIEGDIPKQAGS